MSDEVSILHQQFVEHVIQGTHGRESDTPLLKAATGKKWTEVFGHMPVSAKYNLNIRKIRHSEDSTKFSSLARGGSHLQA